jgi:hypothetical protein
MGGNMQLLSMDFKLVNFIICHNTKPFASKDFGFLRAKAIETAREFCRDLSQWRRISRGRNLSRIIIGETGWPSQRVAKYFTHAYSTAYAMKEFWLAMIGCGRREKLEVHVYSAFDAVDQNIPSTVDVSDSPLYHYGWWERVRNDSSNSDAFVEKFSLSKGETKHHKTTK